MTTEQLHPQKNKKTNQNVEQDIKKKTKICLLQFAEILH